MLSEFGAEELLTSQRDADLLVKIYQLLRF